MFLPKLLDGSKTQTIRRPRKYPIVVGQLLYIYWMLRTPQCFKIGVGVAVNVVRKLFREITIEEYLKDGFEMCPNFLLSCQSTFMEMHPELIDSWDIEFDIISWEWIEGPGRFDAKPFREGPLSPLPL